MKKVLCPECLRSVEYSLDRRNETHRIRGDEITVPTEVAVCPECGSEIGLAEVDDASYAAAFDEYRRRHMLMTPGEIRSLRERYGLGQKAFARLMGWGDVTIARYECGSLQSDSHESALRLAQDPVNMRRLLGLNGSRLTPAQRLAVQRRLDADVRGDALVAREAAARYGATSMSTKLGEMFVFFARQPKMWRTKLNKVAFYADFLHAKRHGASISGARYVHATFGPVPDGYYETQVALTSERAIEEQEVAAGDHVGTVFVALRDADLSKFTPEEIATLCDVAGHFKHWSASHIMRYSHEEPVWLATENGQELPIAQAGTLSLE